MTRAPSTMKPAKRPDRESLRLMEEARLLMPGGVNSPVRSYRAVSGTPPFIESASGALIRDADGNEYIDHVGSWGPMILGHAHPEVVRAVSAQAALGTSYGAPTRLEVELASLVTRMVPSAGRVRMVSSGTEATMSAVRLARAATGRSKILKFEGCYHGHADPFLIKAGSGAATQGVPDSPGVTEGTARDTLTAAYNDLAGVRHLAESAEGGLAAIIVEPVVGNMGVVTPRPGFLQGLRELCDRTGALLIFDEVMTGFRLAPGGAQQRFGVRPDLTTLGKILGGGLPAAAYAGRSDLMQQVAPAGPVYQAGTLSGNPLAMAAGAATLRLIQDDPGLYDRLESAGARLESKVSAAIGRLGAPARMARCGSMWTLFFNPEPVESWTQASACDRERFARWFHGMLDRGQYVAPSQFEANFISAAHTDGMIDSAADACAAALESALG